LLLAGLVAEMELQLTVPEAVLQLSAIDGGRRNSLKHVERFRNKLAGIVEPRYQPAALLVDSTRCYVYSYVLLTVG